MATEKEFNNALLRAVKGSNKTLLKYIDKEVGKEVVFYELPSSLAVRFKEFDNG